MTQPSQPAAPRPAPPPPPAAAPPSPPASAGELNALRARESEQRFRSIFESSAEAILIHRDGRFIMANPAAADLFGAASPEALIGRAVIDFVHPDSRDSVRERIAAMREGAESVPIAEHTLLRLDGSSFVAETHGRRIEIDGRPGVQVIVRDVTAQRAAEAALRANEERFRLVIEQTGQLIYDYELDTGAIQWLGAIRPLTGYEPDEFRTFGIHEWEEHIHPDDRAAAIRALETCLRRGFPYNVEYRFRRKSRGYIDILDNGVFIKDATGKPVRMVGTMRDISEQKRAERSLRESSELQRLMLSELDHRVRNNLASLAALIDITSRGQTSVPQFAGSIRARVQAMSTVHSLLSKGHWMSVQMRQLVRALTPDDVANTVACEGADVFIVPRQATALGMVLQELIANSLKYGALSNRAGNVRVSWTLGDGAEPGRCSMQLEWRERGGPPISNSPARGVGTGLIEGLVRCELSGQAELSFPTEGAHHRFTIEIDAVT